MKTCEICGYRAKKDPTVVTECEDGIWRCKVCREKAMYGKAVSKWAHTVPAKTRTWKTYIKELEGDERMRDEQDR